ncbi:Clp protease N-terminal domain-containing protein [Streptomyces sp. NPDC059104]|uniref:Clp protease N-terminal domain-containing protein n=1 Tax=Streptomyces sp. NPDC059104 TaxID=3346729 RepID=UPI0036A04786
MKAPVERLRAGSVAVYRCRAGQLSAWVAAGRRTDLDGWRAALGPAVRSALLLAAGYAAWRAARWLPPLMWGAAACWLLAAWRAGHPDRQPKNAPTPVAADAPEPEAEPEPVGPAKEQPAGPTIDDVVAAARQLGTPHVHLAAIEEHLGAPKGTARRLLTAAGVPIADVRMHGRGTSTGVRDADIPPFSHPSPEAAVGVVGAGQGANNSNSDAIGVREEAGMTIITDPSERRAYTV